MCSHSHINFTEFDPPANIAFLVALLIKLNVGFRVAKHQKHQS